MSATQRIRVHVEELFLNAPKSHRTIELKEELIANLQDKFSDLVSQGRDEDTAYDIVISSIGDIDELVRSLQEHYILDPEAIDRRRRWSALRISLAIGIYIFAFVPMFLFISEGDVLPGIGIMFFFWAVATALIVYNALSKPKYSKEQDTIIEDFKAYTAVKKNRKALKKSISSAVWTTAVFIFLALGMITHRWNMLWLIFPLAVVVQNILGLTMKEEE